MLQFGYFLTSLVYIGGSFGLDACTAERKANQLFDQMVRSENGMLCLDHLVDWFKDTIIGDRRKLADRHVGILVRPYGLDPLLGVQKRLAERKTKDIFEQSGCRDRLS